MSYINKYKKYMCKQFAIREKDISIKNYKELVKELEKNYKKLISSKDDLLVEKIKEKDESIRNRPIELENIYICSFTLIITIMLGFMNYVIISFEKAYNILLFLVCSIVIGITAIKVGDYQRQKYHDGYHNMCLMILEKIENEYEDNSVQKNKENEQKLDYAIKEINDVKKFIGIR